MKRKVEMKMESKAYPVVQVITQLSKRDIRIYAVKLADKFVDMRIDSVLYLGPCPEREVIEILNQWSIEGVVALIPKHLPILRRLKESGDLIQIGLTPPIVDTEPFQTEFFKQEYIDIKHLQYAREIAMQWFESLPVKASSYTNKNKDLKLNNDNYRKLAYGKRSSIRLGKEDISLGPVRIVNDAAIELYTNAIVTSVSVCSFGSLTQRDAYLDGFKDIGELRAELKRCYNRDIRNTDTVTIIDFDVVDK